MEVSLRYAPVAGGLHTRYAPVRRSPAVYCYTPLPLDLHVLGLPLAFILSQDQTLHCKNCSVTSLTHPCLAPGPPRTLRHTLSLWSHLFQVTLAFQPLAAPSAGRLRLSKAGAKIRTFFKPPNIFFIFFRTARTTRCATGIR